MRSVRDNPRVLFRATLLANANFLHPVLTLFYLHRGLAESEIPLVWAGFSVAVLLFEVPTGALADRFGPRATLIASGAVRAIATAFLIFADGIALFAVAAGLRGLAGALSSGAQEALLYESLKEYGDEHRMDAESGRLQAATMLPNVFGYLLGAYLARDLAEEQFLLLLGLYIAAIFGETAFLLRLVNPRSFVQYRTNPIGHVREGAAIIRRTPNLVFMFLNQTLVFIGAGVGFTMFAQPYLTESGLPVAVLGLLYSAAAMVSWLLASRIGWITARVSRTKLLHWSGAAAVAALAAAAWAPPTVFVAVPVFLVAAWVIVVRWPVMLHLWNEYIPSGSRATTLSLLSMVDSALDLMVVPLMVLLATSGKPAVFAGCALLAAIGALFPVRPAGTTSQPGSDRT